VGELVRSAAAEKVSGDMATEKSLSGGNLGTVLETYGGKSLKRIITVGAAIFGCALTANTVLRVFRPDYIGLMLCVFVFGLGIGLGYVRTNWEAALTKVEVRQGGVRLLVRGGVTWDMKGYLTRWVPGIVELPWDRILKVKVGRFRKIRGWPEHVVIRTTDGKDIEIPFYFWSAVGTERFATIVRRFVEDVEVDVDFL
jgi:hypothetical protein